MKRIFVMTAAATLTALSVGSPALADVSGADIGAGNSFLTAGALAADKPVQVQATTGDYLYWSFVADAGQQPQLAATVALPPAADRHGAQSWTIEVFDGLRRRQPCVDGEQSPKADATADTVTLGCSLRQVRSWAEPWAGDPLPGTYYVRLSSTDLPENDLGLPTKVDLQLALPAGNTGDDQGTLAAPLTPDNRSGKVLTGAAEPSAAPVDDSTFAADWLPELSSRWAWTIGGGALAAVTGVIGFSMTRRRRVA